MRKLFINGLAVLASSNLWVCCADNEFQSGRIEFTQLQRISGDYQDYALSPDGKKLAIAWQEKPAITIFQQQKTGEKFEKLSDDYRFLHLKLSELKFGPEGEKLAFIGNIMADAEEEGECDVNIVCGSSRKTLHNFKARQISFNRDGSLLAVNADNSVRYEKGIYLWNIGNGVVQNYLDWTRSFLSSKKLKLLNCIFVEEDLWVAAAGPEDKSCTVLFKLRGSKENPCMQVNSVHQCPEGMKYSNITDKGNIVLSPLRSTASENTSVAHIISLCSYRQKIISSYGVDSFCLDDDDSDDKNWFNYRPTGHGSIAVCYLDFEHGEAFLEKILPLITMETKKNVLVGSRNDRSKDLMIYHIKKRCDA